MECDVILDVLWCVPRSYGVWKGSCDVFIAIVSLVMGSYFTGILWMKTERQMDSFNLTSGQWHGPTMIPTDKIGLDTIYYHCYRILWMNFMNEFYEWKRKGKWIVSIWHPGQWHGSKIILTDEICLDTIYYHLHRINSVKLKKILSYVLNDMQAFILIFALRSIFKKAFVSLKSKLVKIRVDITWKLSISPGPVFCL